MCFASLLLRSSMSKHGFSVVHVGNSLSLLLCQKSYSSNNCLQSPKHNVSFFGKAAVVLLTCPGLILLLVVLVCP